MPQQSRIRIAGAYALVTALLVVACSDDRGNATGPSMAAAGQTAVTAGAMGPATSTAGSAAPAAGGAGAAAAGRAGATSSGTGGGVSAGMGGALAAGTGGSAGASTAGAPAAGAPASGAAGAAGATPDPNADTCDRACLIAIVKGYSDALVAKNSSKLKVSTTLKYTENGVVAKLGDTVWKTAMSIVADTILTFADPVNGQVASQFVFTESGSTQKIYQVRLKVVKHEITEIESRS